MSGKNDRFKKNIWLNWLLLLLLLVGNSLALTACVKLHKKDNPKQENVKEKGEKGEKGEKSKNQVKPQPTSPEEKYQEEGEDRIDDDDPE